MKKTLQKIFKKIRIFFHNVGKIIDKKIIVPVTKAVLAVTSNFDKSSKFFETWLSKSTSLLFISLFLAITIFIVIDQKIISFSKNSAEVLKSQPVKAIYNEEAYVVEGLPESVDVTLIGSKTDLYIAKQSSTSDITVDLTGLKPGTHKVNIKYNQGSSSIEYSVNPSVATVIIYPKVSETKPLTVDLLNQNKLDSKLVIENVSINNDNVIIKGADYQLKQVATVKALIDINNLVSQEVGTVSLKDVPLKAYDSNGNVVDVEIVPAKIDAEITISSPSKEVNIRVVPTGTVAFGKAISSITLNSQKVTVYGSEDVLNDLTSIPVKIDVTDLDETRQYKVELEKPVGVKSMSINNVLVTISLDKESTREVSGINIEYENLSDAYTVQGLSASDVRVTVVLKGVESVIDDIQASDIKAYLDLNGYGEGEYEVDVHVEGTDTKVQYIAKTTKVKIKVIRK